MSVSSERAAPLDEIRAFVERAMAELKSQTGDDHSAYYTKGLTNWLPDLCGYLVSLADRLEAAERLKEEIISAADAATRGEEAMEARVTQLQDVILTLNEEGEALEARVERLDRELAFLLSRWAVKGPLDPAAEIQALRASVLLHPEDASK